MAEAPATPRVVPIYYIYEPTVLLDLPTPPYFNFLRDLLLFDADIMENESTSWSFQLTQPEPFFTSTLDDIAAGSIIVMQAWHLEDRSVVPESPYALSDRRLSTPRSWRLWNVSQPLVVVIYDAAGCTLSIPTGTHHVIYLASWCERYHRDWKRSRRLEHSAFLRPWLRDAPFGSAFDGGALARLQAERRDVLERRILFSFRGSAPASKPKRAELMAASGADRVRLAAIARGAMQGRVPPHPSTVGWYLLDIVDNSPQAVAAHNGSVAPYETADAITCELLIASERVYLLLIESDRTADAITCELLIAGAYA